MIFLKIFIDSICGVLNAIGGWHILWMRRYLMPVVMATAVSFLVHLWWCGLMMLPVMGTLCIGYGKDGNFGRSLWIGLQCFVLGLGLCITGHLLWYFYLPYVLLGCVFGGIYRNWPQWLGDSITGSYMASIIFLVR